MSPPFSSDPAGQEDRFASARLVADTVLYEGYVLYPYRASAQKNQLRWQFGVLAPPAYALSAGSERSSMRSEVIVDPAEHPQLTVRIRCLQVQHRDVARSADGGQTFTMADSISVDGTTVMTWDEALDREVDLDVLDLLPIAGARRVHPFVLPAGEESELLRNHRGEIVGRVSRHREEISGRVQISVEHGEDGRLIKVTIVVENTTPWNETDPADRDRVMRRSLIAVHTLLAVDDAAFMSLLEPPEHAAQAVAGCSNDGTFPVMIGSDETNDVMLSSPIILYDFPAVAPESAGDFCDSTEIDEILALRVMTLTDEEKAEARGTDARAAAIIDRCDDMPDEIWTRLHGAVRSLRPVDTSHASPSDTLDTLDGVPTESTPWWDPGQDSAFDPFTDTMRIGGIEVGNGTHVRLKPSRRADAHDLFYAGRLATVKGVFNDVDGDKHVAVALDDDPASDMLEWQGRFLYFHPDEIEVLT